jgi:hypothetical protein
VCLSSRPDASYPKQWATDPYVLAPNATSSVRVDEKVDGMSYPAYVRGEGAVVPSLFGAFDARLLRRNLASRGQPVRLRVGAKPSLYTEWLAFLLEHPAAWPSLATCPAPVLLQRGSWRYKFVARAARQPAAAAGVAGAPRVAGATVTLSGAGDPGYVFTSIGLAEMAMCLGGASTRGCASGRRGVLTPESAINRTALVGRLESIGVLNVDVNVDVDRTAVRPSARVLPAAPPSECNDAPDAALCCHEAAAAQHAHPKESVEERCDGTPGCDFDYKMYDCVPASVRAPPSECNDAPDAALCCHEAAAAQHAHPKESVEERCDGTPGCDFDYKMYDCVPISLEWQAAAEALASVRAGTSLAAVASASTASKPAPPRPPRPRLHAPGEFDR